MAGARHVASVGQRGVLDPYTAAAESTGDAQGFWDVAKDIGLPAETLRKRGTAGRGRSGQRLIQDAVKLSDMPEGERPQHVHVIDAVGPGEHPVRRPSATSRAYRHIALMVACWLRRRADARGAGVAIDERRSRPQFACPLGVGRVQTTAAPGAPWPYSR
jgi:hypothetical protein